MHVCVTGSPCSMVEKKLYIYINDFKKLKKMKPKN